MLRHAFYYMAVPLNSQPDGGSFFVPLKISMAFAGKFYPIPQKDGKFSCGIRSSFLLLSHILKKRLLKDKGGKVQWKIPRNGFFRGRNGSSRQGKRATPPPCAIWMTGCFLGKNGSPANGKARRNKEELHAAGRLPDAWSFLFPSPSGRSCAHRTKGYGLAGGRNPIFFITLLSVRCERDRAVWAAAV